MSRTGENIHKRKDGRWEARILISDKWGYSRYISLYGKSYREVKEKKMNMGAIYKKETSTKMTLADVLREWSSSNLVNQKGATQLKYKNIIDNHISKDLGALEINQIDEVLIQAFLSRKLMEGRLNGSGGLSSSYVKTMGIILNSVINYAVARGYCDKLKTKINKPFVEKKEIAILRLDEQINLENAIIKDSSLTALGIYISLNTGMRIGEICALKWQDIDLANHVIYVRHTVARIASPGSPAKTALIIDKPKTHSSSRDIPITSKLEIMLKAFKGKNIGEYVISERESFISPRTYEYRFHRFLKDNGIKDINFHCLRHTFATRCIEFNMDIKTLSEILGHANVGITLDTYVHPSFELKKSQMEKLSELGKE